MSKKEKKNKDGGRVDWLDDADGSPLIDDYANQLSHFIDALADGKIDRHELEKQESRLAKHLKKVEKMLDDEQHAAVTELLCEVSAYSAMQVLHSLAELVPAAKTRLNL
ncbi:MAG: hypothetical protein KatS3mg108_3757 [Isosphaeraceae bacterium]|jgi:DNA-directed RNA polymerase subunit F|nr:MAG: hypothetical protein KatS3mg108_3757 [Isosphaeraceae bacterium]